MTLYIITVLALACYQSFSKLSLLPRWWIFGAAGLAGTLPFFFEERIARSSMLELNQVLSDPAVLNNWCALIVIQELMTLLAGFSLLGDQSAENRYAGKKKWRAYLRKWKYVLFVPSLLLPAGILYFQMYLYNHDPATDFRLLTWKTALCVCAVTLFVAFGLKLLHRKEEKRILTVLHAEYILLLPAIFLPVAAHAKWIPANEKFDFSQPLLLLLLFTVIIIIFTIFFYMKGKHHVNRNTNP